MKMLTIYVHMQLITEITQYTHTHTHTHTHTDITAIMAKLHSN